MLSSQDRPFPPASLKRSNSMTDKSPRLSEPFNHYVSVRQTRSSNPSKRGVKHSAVDLGPCMVIWKRLQKNLTSSEIRKYFSCQLAEEPVPAKQMSGSGSMPVANSIHIRPSDGGCGEEDLASLRLTPDVLFDSQNTGKAMPDTSTEEFRFLYETACNDDRFTTICLLFDRKVDARFEMIAQPHLEGRFSEDVSVTALIKDILLYSHWKNFGVKDPTEHTERQARLVCLAEAFKDVRRISGLSPYEEIRERYLWK